MGSNLFNDNELGMILGEGEELGNIFKALGKVGKLALGAAKFVPGIGQAVGAAEGVARGAIGALGKKKGKAAPAAKKAHAKSKVTARKKPAAKSKGVEVSTDAAGISGGAAPVIMAEAKPLDTARLVNLFRAQVTPHLSAIANQLQHQNLQAQISSEHRGRVGRSNFERKVLARLKNPELGCPPNLEADLAFGGSMLGIENKYWYALAGGAGLFFIYRNRRSYV